MVNMIVLCPTCGIHTPHRSDGYSTSEIDADGRTSQVMQCSTCKTSTRVYFAPGSNEFQENLDTPDRTDAEPGASAADRDS